MSITVRPDPDHPLGGHALLVVAGRAADGPVSVSVVDLFEDRHLGPKGWQAAPVSLGPYAAYDDGDTLVVPVGPEVVDHIEEYATVRLSVAGATAELAWPETIRMSPRRTGAQPVPPHIDGKAPPKPTVAPPPPPPEPQPPAPEPEPQPPVGEKDAVEPAPSRSLLPLILAALLLLAAIGGGAWWYLNQPVPVIEEVVAPPVEEGAEEPAEEETQQAATPPAAGCDAAGLAAAAAMEPAAGFAAIAGCGAQGDPEARFRIIEAAAEAGVGEAIAMIGRWYDPAEAAAVGSNFTRQDPAQAARYFKEAVAAGYAEAEALLTRACGALNPDADPTHEIARELYCPRP